MKNNRGMALFFFTSLILVLLFGVLMLYRMLDAYKQAAQARLSLIDELADERAPLALQLADELAAQSADFEPLRDDINRCLQQWDSAESFEEKSKADMLITKTLNAAKTHAEKYENIKSSRAFSELFGDKGVEAALTAMRANYNEAVKLYNKSLVVFPYNTVAWLFKLQPLPLYPESDK